MTRCQRVGRERGCPRPRIREQNIVRGHPDQNIVAIGIATLIANGNCGRLNGNDGIALANLMTNGSHRSSSRGYGTAKKIAIAGAGAGEVEFAIAIGTAVANAVAVAVADG